jgi:hypothetical protein
VKKVAAHRREGLGLIFLSAGVSRILRRLTYRKYDSQPWRKYSSIHDSERAGIGSVILTITIIVAILSSLEWIMIRRPRSQHLCIDDIVH